jgi:uncharacterized RDD family membrane protein YckC
MTNTPLPPAGFLRRFGALFYDSLVVLAIIMMAGGIVIAVMEALVAAGLLSYAPYSDASDLLSRHPTVSVIYTLYLAFVWIGFFAFFWTRGGQTLGMRAWKIEIQNLQGGRITMTQALIRVATSAFGLANLAVLIDPKKRGFHDIWAKTQVVVLPKAK